MHLEAVGDVELYGNVGEVYLTSQLTPWVDTAEIEIASQADVNVYELVNATIAIAISGENVNVIGDSVVRTRGNDSAVFIEASENILVQRDPAGVARRALVEGSDLVHLHAKTISIEGAVQATDSAGRVLINSSGDIMISGTVEPMATPSFSFARSSGFAMADLSG